MTLDNVKAGYIPRSFTRDPAWYTDISELIGDYRADGRIPDRVAAKLIDGVERAQRQGEAGHEVLAILFLEEVVAAGAVGAEARRGDARRGAASDAGARRPAAGGEADRLRPRASRRRAGVAGPPPMPTAQCRRLGSNQRTSD